MERREFLSKSLSFSIGAWGGALATVRGFCNQGAIPMPKIGFCTFSCQNLWKIGGKRPSGTKVEDAVGFYEYARALGADGVQTSVRSSDPKYAVKLRSLVEKTDGYFEADLRLPKESSDVERFESDVVQAKNAGAVLGRAVCLGGRRYEVFSSLNDFESFRRSSQRSLEWSVPILKKHSFRLAIENHKDFLSGEFVDLIKGIGSEWIGILVDTGNNVALLEEPHKVVATLAPFAWSVHLKDMAIQPDPRGFLLSEVPFGTGFLNLHEMCTTLIKSNSKIVFNIEMATRDPLLIPCQEDRYWSSFPPGWQESNDRDKFPPRPHSGPIPKTSDKEIPVVVEEEEANNRQCLRWMKEKRS